MEEIEFGVLILLVVVGLGVLATLAFAFIIERF